MSRSSTATREQHDDFCNVEGWELVRGARGKPVRHHRTYKLLAPDGRVLRTRVSRPVNSTQYPKSMWAHILKEQLIVTDQEFRACVEEQILPDRSIPSGERPGLPYHLLQELQRTTGIEATEAVSYSETEAKQCIADHWQRIAEEESPPG